MILTKRGCDNMILEVSEVNKYFGGLHVLQDVSFTVNQGEILGLIGPNGAGKSTIFNVITGVYRPNGGSIKYNGNNFVASNLTR